jgi:hypothetical protein
LFRIVFGGVFERHPSLNVMFTEQPATGGPRLDTNAE